MERVFQSVFPSLPHRDHHLVCTPGNHAPVESGSGVAVGMVVLTVIVRGLGRRADDAELERKGAPAEG